MALIFNSVLTGNIHFLVLTITIVAVSSIEYRQTVHGEAAREEKIPVSKANILKSISEQVIEFLVSEEL